MTTELQKSKLNQISLVRGGPTFGMLLHLGLEHPNTRRRMLKVLLLVLVTWLPLLLLSLVSGHAFGKQVAVPLLHDPVIYSRFLFALPLLALAEVIVDTSLAAQRIVGTI